MWMFFTMQIIFVFILMGIIITIADCYLELGVTVMGVSYFRLKKTLYFTISFQK